MAQRWGFTHTSFALPGMVIVDPAPWSSATEVPGDLQGFFRPQDFGAYFRGNVFGAVAIGGRLDDTTARAIAREHRQMSRSNLEAWEIWKSNAPK